MLEVTLLITDAGELRSFAGVAFSVLRLMVKSQRPCDAKSTHQTEVLLEFHSLSDFVDAVNARAKFCGRPSPRQTRD